MSRFLVAALLTSLALGGCRGSNSGSGDEAGEGTEITFYHTYGYRHGGDWVIPVRAWAHGKRSAFDKMVAAAANAVVHCSPDENVTLESRFADFKGDSKSGDEKVAFQFASDPDGQQFTLPARNLNGIAVMDLRIPEAKARRLLSSQKSGDGWLNFAVVSKGTPGKGRVRLLERTGLSVVSDIDDTIKVTGVPGDKLKVLQATFCREFVSAPEMIRRYKEFGDASFHYLSGGPWQMYGPLYGYLVSGPGGFPEGTFHFNDFPKNLLSPDTWSRMRDVLVGSLNDTFQHKVTQIATLMERLPDRKYILIGDSGEGDPEVYRAIRNRFPDKVQEIRIRDVLHEKRVNGYRLSGMTVIEAARVCATPEHYDKLAAFLQKHYPGEKYTRNPALCE